MKPPILGAGPRGLSASVFQCLPRDLVGFSVCALHEHAAHTDCKLLKKFKNTN